MMEIKLPSSSLGMMVDDKIIQKQVSRKLKESTFSYRENHNNNGSFLGRGLGRRSSQVEISKQPEVADCTHLDHFIIKNESAENYSCSE